MREYRKAYGYAWFQHEWSIQYTDYIREAYLDSLRYYSEYLDGTRPFLLSHYFSPHFWKQFIKRIFGG